MRNILKPVCLFVVSALLVSVMSDNASAGGRRWCRNSANTWSGTTYTVPVLPAIVSTSNVATNGMVQADGRTQYQSAFQAPAPVAPVYSAPVAPVYYVRQYNTLPFANEYFPHHGWDQPLDAGRKIRGL